MAEFVRYDEERFYLNPVDAAVRIPFGSISEPASLSLTVVVPAKNEESRLPRMLDECLEHLQTRRRRDPRFSFEVIIVDDGSTDRTAEVALDYSRRWSTDRVRVLKLRHNRGKGGAVRLGVLGARGDNILFADADGATRFSDVDRVEEALRSLSDHDQGSVMALAVGSRVGVRGRAAVQRSPLRAVLMLAFHLLVWLFCTRRVVDTQCGFKMFTRPAALLLFLNLRMERWAFDAELLHVAELLDIPVVEVSVNWTEVPGSKLSLVSDSVKMAIDLFLIWFCYFFGFWTIDPSPKTT